jgi:hypothetical protein
LPDGDFYDPNGYYFDKNGFDEYGGYYEGLYYQPGPGYEAEYYKRYQEIYGAEDEGADEEDEYNIEDYFTESEGEEEEYEELK